MISLSCHVSEARSGGEGDFFRERGCAARPFAVDFEVLDVVGLLAGWGWVCEELKMTGCGNFAISS